MTLEQSKCPNCKRAIPETTCGSRVRNCPHCAADLFTPPVEDEEALFRKALELSSEARDEFVRDACGNNPALRDRIEELLRASETTDGLLDQVRDDSLMQEPIDEPTGKVIGRYKLLQKIGEGGFGVVYMAEQLEPVKRKVAFKVIKPGMDSKAVTARFEAERQALAMMDHTHIANVFDGGSTK